MDLIDRQEAIASMKETKIAYTGGWHKGLALAIDRLRDLPAANVQDFLKDAWIPCSERLPEKEGWYLISVKTGNVTKAFYRVAPIKQGGCYWRGHITKPTAWMPLPDPYREGDDD